MRADDLSDGSLKAFLILALVLANLAVAHLRHPRPGATLVGTPSRIESASPAATRDRATSSEQAMPPDRLGAWANR